MKYTDQDLLIYHSISVWLGLPPHVSSPTQLSTVALMSRDPENPRPFMVQVEIQRQVVRYSTALAGEIDSSTAASMMNLFSNELDTLYTVYKGLWSTRLEIQLLRAKLYLYSHCLNVASKSRSNVGRFGEQSDFDSSKILIHQGLHSAVSLIHNSQKLNFPSSAYGDETSGRGTLIHYPKYYLQTVMFAVVFLLKFLSTNQKAAQQDRELAYSHITTAHQIFSSFPDSPESLRVVEVIEYLVENLKESDENGTPPTRSRLGASLMYNTFTMLGADRQPVSTQIASDPSKSSVQVPEVTLLTESDNAMESTPTVWGSNDLTSPFTPAKSTMQDELGAFQWNSDGLFFDIPGLHASIGE